MMTVSNKHLSLDHYPEFVFTAKLSNFLDYFPYDQRKDECSLLEKRLHCEPKLSSNNSTWKLAGKKYQINKVQNYS